MMKLHGVKIWPIDFEVMAEISRISLEVSFILILVIGWHFAAYVDAVPPDLSKGLQMAAIVVLTSYGVLIILVRWVVKIRNWRRPQSHRTKHDS